MNTLRGIQFRLWGSILSVGLLVPTCSVTTPPASAPLATAVFVAAVSTTAVSCDPVDNDELPIGDGDEDGYVACPSDESPTPGLDGPVPQHHSPRAKEACDCKDDDSASYPGATEIPYDGIDQDCSGTDLTDVDGDGHDAIAVSNGDDCNDNNTYTYPGAPEACDGIDNDCNGAIDDDTEDVSWYRDADADSHGNATASQSSCSQPEGYVRSSDDCDDTDAGTYPGAPELCDDKDNDCDSDIDEDATDKSSWYRDADSDSYGDARVSIPACTAPEGYVADNTDCDDTNALAYPGADEVCDGYDTDCDGEIDEDGPTDIYVDTDGDGYGSDVVVLGCADTDGYAPTDGDCDDLDTAVNPGATEKCDGIDNDCNGNIDGGAVDATTYYADADGDTFGNSEVHQRVCAQPAGYVLVPGDCDDNYAGTFPGADEYCDNQDNNCDTVVDESPVDGDYYFADADEDGFGDLLTPSNSACVAPDGYVDNSRDCDDTEAAVNPDATEVCNGIDDNCDVLVDNGASDATVWYIDNDNDGYGVDSDTNKTSCTAPDGYVADAGDCNDSDSTVYPDALEVCDGKDNNCNDIVDSDSTVETTVYLDSDGDGYGATVLGGDHCADQAGETATGGDCDDTNAAVNPAARESCNGLDDNCNGAVDDSATDFSTFYRDADGDTWGASSSTTQACAAPTGYVAKPGDCDDTIATTYPLADEYCDGIDNNCDEVTDENAVDAATWYADADDDHYGDSQETRESCDEPVGYVDDDTDCNDDDSYTHPSAEELCDGIDNNCDGQIDEGAAEPRDWYADADSDGYGDKNTTAAACSQPAGYVTDNTDCDDTNPAVNPGATEACNNIDDDCDRKVDDEDKDFVVLNQSIWYRDADSDGYGSAAVETQLACQQPPGYSATAGDCNDSNSTINPSATETCNGVDDNCDGAVPSNEADADTDGSRICGNDCNDTNNTVYPGAAELCDALDNNCDTVVDEGVMGTGSSCAALDCVDVHADNPSRTDGLYWIDAGLDSPFQGYCDLLTDEGGWTLVAVIQPGNTSHANVNSVGTLTAPDQTAVAKLSDTQINALRGASLGNSLIRWRDERYDGQYQDYFREDLTFSAIGSGDALITTAFSSYENAVANTNNCVGETGGSNHNGFSAYGCTSTNQSIWADTDGARPTWSSSASVWVKRLP